MKNFHDYDSIYIKAIVAIVEIMILNAVALLSIELFPQAIRTYSKHLTNVEPMRAVFVTINMAYLLAFSWVGVVLDKRTVYVDKILNKVLRMSVLFFICTFTVLYLIKIYISVTFLICTCLTLFAAWACWRMLARLILKLYRSHGGNNKRVIILGSGNVANELHSQLISNISYGYKFLGYFDNVPQEEYKVDAEMVKGCIDDVAKFCEENDVEEIFCALPAGNDRAALPVINFAENNCIRCYIVPDFKRFIKKKVSLSFIEDIPLVSLRSEPLMNFSNRIAKRLFDIVFSGLFLITIFPILFIVLGAIIKFTSKGPIFFKQKRTGENGEDFYCYKFRSMQDNKDADSKQATKGDARVTPIGAFMRKTNLDEMPQFINVLIGNMSIVGPRPHMLKHTKEYSELIDKYMIRHLAKPGITGWAQVTGFRGETQTLEEMEGRVKRDVWYIENWTFWLDIKIIFLTVYNMIHGEEKAY